MAQAGHVPLQRPSGLRSRLPGKCFQLVQDFGEGGELTALQRLVE